MGSCAAARSPRTLTVTRCFDLEFRACQTQLLRYLGFSTFPAWGRLVIQVNSVRSSRFVRFYDRMCTIYDRSRWVPRRRDLCSRAHAYNNCFDLECEDGQLPDFVRDSGFSHPHDSENGRGQGVDPFYISHRSCNTTNRCHDEHVWFKLDFALICFKVITIYADKTTAKLLRRKPSRHHQHVDR